MSTHTRPISQTREEEQQAEEPIETRVNEMSSEFADKYPMPEFSGPSRKPETGWMVIDLVAYPASSPDHPVIRTFQARDLINDDVAVRLPALRAQCFFTEVRKLLVFCENKSCYHSVWYEDVLNEHAVHVQDAKIVALIDGAAFLDSKQVLEEGQVVELFEKATDMGLERLTFFVEWYTSSISQEISIKKHQVRQRASSTSSMKRFSRKTRTTL